MSSSSTSEIPTRFICPLTLEVMKYPYQDQATGKTYERSAILEWMCNSDDNALDSTAGATCPLTRQPLDPANFSPNNELLLEIYEWKRRNNLLDVEQDQDNSAVATPSSPQDTATATPSRRKKCVTIQDVPTVEDPACSDLTHLSQKILKKRQDKAKRYVASRRSRSPVPQVRAVPTYMQMYM